MIKVNKRLPSCAKLHEPHNNRKQRVLRQQKGRWLRPPSLPPLYKHHQLKEYVYQLHLLLSQMHPAHFLAAQRPLNLPVAW